MFALQPYRKCWLLNMSSSPVAGRLLFAGIKFKIAVLFLFQVLYGNHYAASA